MRVSGFTTTRPDVNGTRTAESFMKFLGDKPERLGIVSKLYDQYTATNLTEAIMNVYSMDKDKKNHFQSINSFLVEWDISVSKIKRVKILAVEGDGKNASDVKFYFPENYYQRHETFVVERTRQQFIVMNTPQRIAENRFLVIAQILDNDYDSVVDTLGGDLAGCDTRFVTNIKPEMHSEGFVKAQSNVEKHRTYIATHRADVDMSNLYKPMEDVFIQVAKGEGMTQKGDPVYKMNTAEKDCLDSFMEARNNALLWSKTNMDESGKPKHYDALGRPLISSDGIIPQIERFATKFVFNRMNVAYFEKALQALVAKSEKPQGNKYTLIANTAFYNEFQRVMGAWLADRHTDGAYLYSKEANGYISLGATYEGYRYGGNELYVKIDRSLDIEFPTRKYAMIVDLTEGSTNGVPAIALFTFKGGEIINNNIPGVGGKTGLESGTVSSPVAGQHLAIWGYAGVGVMNPYRSVILLGEEDRDSFWK